MIKISAYNGYMEKSRLYIILFLLLWVKSPVFAQHNHEHSSCDTDTFDHIKEAILSEVTVEGLTGRQRLKDSPSPFVVLSPRMLHQTIGTNLVDVVSLLPGLSQMSTGPGISKPVIRGLGSSRVVVVDQGIRQEGQQWGEEHGLEIDADNVHSVEILKGPASLMYGSDAIAGVMILHPELPLMANTVQVRAGGEYQSNNSLYKYTTGFSGNVDGWLWNWHYSYKSAHCYKNKRDSYVPGSWYNEQDLSGLLGVNRTWGHSWLRFSCVDFVPGIVEGERNDDGQLIWEDGNSAKSYSRQLPSQRILHTKIVSDNMINIKEGTLKFVLGYQQNFRREFEECLDDASLAMRLHTVNYDLKYLFHVGDIWDFATGMGGMWQQNVNVGNEYLIPDYRLFDYGVFFTAGCRLGRWHLSGGMRFDNRSLSTSSLEEEGELRFVSLCRHFNGLTGSIGAVYNINEQTNVRVNVSRGFRAPTVSELSSNGVHEGSVQYEVGNGSLNPEYSTQVDVGMDYTSAYMSLNASLFVNRISDYVFLSRLDYETDGYRTYQYRQGDARLIGGELSLDIHPVRTLHWENAFSYVRGIQLHQNNESRNLPLVPMPRWTSEIRYEMPRLFNGLLLRTNVGISMECCMRQNKYYGFDDTETATGGYSVFNISMSTDVHVFGHNCVNLSVVCKNVFDKAYQSHLSRLKYTDGPGVFAMGRNICVKLSMPIDIHLAK
ncbi:MAG: TonB-dependent receptor plug domain-containing protein [Prevotella sp.]